MPYTKIKLFTALYDDARILGHFLKHYRKAGVTDFHIAVLPGMSSAVVPFTSAYNITILEDPNVADSFCSGVSAVTAMRHRHQGEEEWAVVADLDEFIEFPGDIPGLIQRAESEGANVIRGIMYDRFSSDGKLVGFDDSSDLYRLYPVKARFTSTVMEGCDHKGVLVKGHLAGAMAHHEFHGERIGSTVLEISHFKWNDRAVERVGQAYAIISTAGLPCSVEYKRALDHYHRHGRFAWQEFGGVYAEARGEECGGAAISARTSRHPRDITADDLIAASAVSERPDLLLQLIGIARGAFGFYVGQFTYTINYPWIAARLESLPPGSRVLDIGAGLNPLPLWLASRDVLVDCVDPHPITRSLPSTDDWNEWGFFDYARLHPSLTSHHCAIADFTPMAGFDAIYAVCVLAHMPRAVRQDALRRCREWLRPGGKLLLAIDLIPGTDFLWNRSEEKEVEPLLAHGTTQDLLRELAGLGLQLNQSAVRRTLPKSRTDLLLVDCSAP